MDGDESTNQKPTTNSILDTLGEEIMRIIIPVSACMFLVVLLVTTLNSSTSASIATIAYDEKPSDSIWSKLSGAVVNSLVFVAIITATTFLLLLLFYLRCTRFLKLYMAFSSFLVLSLLGGELLLSLLRRLSLPLDLPTFILFLLNFSAAGVTSLFLPSAPILLTQSYLVLIAMLVAFWFTLLPEWTTWALLLALALYDLAAVLLPGGPLRLLVELAISRDEDIPALVYEARPVHCHHPTSRRWRERPDAGPPDGGRDPNLTFSRSPSACYSSPNSDPLNLADGSDRGETRLDVICENGPDSPHYLGKSATNSESDRDPNDANCTSTRGDLLSAIGESVNPNYNPNLGDNWNEIRLHITEESGVIEGDSVSELTVPLIVRPLERSSADVEEDLANRTFEVEGIGLGSSGAIKLGLGDFIFYSVLVGRASMYDFMTVYACYLAVIAGLGITLMLLAFYRKALPALPVSITLGVLFYFLTRIFLEVFIVQCSENFLMF